MCGVDDETLLSFYFHLECQVLRFYFLLSRIKMDASECIRSSARVLLKLMPEKSERVVNLIRR